MAGARGALARTEVRGAHFALNVETLSFEGKRRRLLGVVSSERDQHWLAIRCRMVKALGTRAACLLAWSHCEVKRLESALC